MAMTTETTRGIGIRAVAVLIDFVIWILIGYVLALVTGSTTGAGFDLQGLPAAIWFLSFWVYYIVLEAEYGQTVGKKAVGIKVVNETGGSIDYRESLIRNVLRIVDGFFFYLVGPSSCTGRARTSGWETGSRIRKSSRPEESSGSRRRCFWSHPGSVTCSE